MSTTRCAACFDDEAYAKAIYELTIARRDALQEARHLVVLSRYMARELEAVGLADARVIPPWVDVGGAPVVGESLLIAGRLVSHKGVIAACRAWRQSSVSRALLVAGDGPLAAEVESSGATLLGWLSAEQLRERLRGALALLLPSAWEEPFGIIGVEALAEGTPVILMQTGGTADWSDRGCVVVPAGDTAAMADAIERLAGDETLARKLGQRGQEMVRQRFGREVLLPKLSLLYDELVA
jgi:glycosyltransferase involved in cell wall biosynthesis